MKLVLAIVQSADARRLQHALVAEGIPSTTLASMGGFLREGTATILIGVEDRLVDRAMQTIRLMCHAREQLPLIASWLPAVEQLDALPSAPVKERIGGAVAFVLEVDRMLTLGTRPPR